MSENYEPASDFLKSVIAEEVTLFGSAFGDANLQQLITMTRDDDLSNRDWATFLLSQQDADTPEIRAALLVAVNDQDGVVRAEALLGIAQRDTELALPFAIRALAEDMAHTAVFEAAQLIANCALVESLRPWPEPSEDEWFDKLARDALAACEAGTSKA